MGIGIVVILLLFLQMEAFVNSAKASIIHLAYSSFFSIIHSAWHTAGIQIIAE